MAAFRELQPLAPAANGGEAALASLCSFVRRARGSEKRALTAEELANVQSKFQMADVAAAQQCCEALWRLIETVVRGTLNVEAVGVLLKDSVTPPLAQALATVCAEQQGAWKADAIRGTVSVPKLQGVNWRVDVKTASSHAAGLGLPTVIMQLQVEPGRTVAFEMDKETLQAMLSGLGKIRDQLNRM